MGTISTILNDAKITSELTSIFEAIKKKLNAPFVPNFFKVWGHAPIALKGIYPAMQYILADGELSRTLKEMIMIAISSSKECSCCETTHHAFCATMGGRPEQIYALKTTSSLTKSANTKEKLL